MPIAPLPSARKKPRPGRGPLPYAIPPVPVGSQAGIIGIAAPLRSGPARGNVSRVPTIPKPGNGYVLAGAPQSQFPRRNRFVGYSVNRGKKKGPGCRRPGPSALLRRGGVPS